MNDDDDERDDVDELAVAAATRRLEQLAHEHPELVGDTTTDNVRAWIETLTDDERQHMTPRDTKESTTQVAFRLPDNLIKRIDAHAERLSKAHPGLTFTRVDAVRTLLATALDDVEATDKRRGGKG